MTGQQQGYGPLIWKDKGGNRMTFESGAELVLVPGSKVGPASGSMQTLPIADANQAAVATTAPTNVSPYGYTQAQAAAIIAELNAIRSALIAVGVIKGSA